MRQLRIWSGCLLYTSDAADERSSVDLGGRRIIKKKKKENTDRWRDASENKSETVIEMVIRYEHGKRETVS